MKHLLRGLLSMAMLLGLALLAPAGEAEAATNCQLIDDPDSMTLTLRRNCWTDETIFVPDGYTLEGNNRTITARDPAGPGTFVGAVVQNAGSWAGVNKVRIRTNNLANACKAGDDRLRGIMFEEGSGIISNNRIIRLNKGASGCQEGNGIEVRNPPFDGTNPDTKQVAIVRNQVENYQKTGIIINGDVSAEILHNKVGASATQANLAANSIQLGFGAGGTIANNRIEPNYWCCTPWAATGILVHEAADGFKVNNNNIRGNGDIGIYLSFSDNGEVNGNMLFKRRHMGLYDFGIINYGTDNVIDRNTVIGYGTPFSGPTSGQNRGVQTGPSI